MRLALPKLRFLGCFLGTYFWCRYFSKVNILLVYIHTTYTSNNTGQKCEGNCGLWVLNEILKKTYSENLKKIVGAVWKLPAKGQ